MMRLVSVSLFAVLTVALAVAMGIGTPGQPKQGGIADQIAARKALIPESAYSTVTWSANVKEIVSDRQIKVYRHGIGKDITASVDGPVQPVPEDVVTCETAYVPGPYGSDKIPDEAVIRHTCWLE